MWEEMDLIIYEESVELNYLRIFCSNGRVVRASASDTAGRVRSPVGSYIRLKN